MLILGGTRFIGRRIAADLVARGDEVTVVHRGQTETAEPDGCAHWHTDRAAFASLAGQVRALRPDAVIDTRALTAADAEAVLPHLPDAQLVLLSSIGGGSRCRSPRNRLCGKAVIRSAACSPVSASTTTSSTWNPVTSPAAGLRCDCR